MKHFAVFAMCALIWSAAASAQTASPSPSATAAVGAPKTTTVFVPKGTVVVVATAEAINSYAASPREPIDYTVAQDVVVDGNVIAKAGDEADGQVLEAQQGETGFDGIGYKAADLRISVDAIHNFCGDTIKMFFIRSEYRARQGFLGSERDIEIIDGQKYIALTAYPQKICGQSTTEADPLIPGDALPGDKN